MKILYQVAVVSVAISLGFVMQAAQAPAPAAGGRGQGGGRGGAAPTNAAAIAAATPNAGNAGLIGGSILPDKPDARGWGWQVKALMSPDTPRPLYNRAKELLLQDKVVTSYTISSFNTDLYCDVRKHFDFIWFEMQHSTMSWDEVRRMILTCPGVDGGAPVAARRAERLRLPVAAAPPYPSPKPSRLSGFRVVSSPRRPREAGASSLTLSLACSRESTLRDRFTFS